MDHFINSNLILSSLKSHNIPVLSADDFSIQTPLVEIRPEHISSKVTGELLVYIELDKSSPHFNDLYPEDLADSDILHFIINEHAEEMKRHGWA